MTEKDGFWRGVSLIFSFGRQKSTRKDPMENFIHAVDEVMKEDKQLKK